jgi:hypothetical protein
MNNKTFAVVGNATTAVYPRRHHKCLGLAPTHRPFVRRLPLLPVPVAEERRVESAQQVQELAQGFYETSTFVS